MNEEQSKMLRAPFADGSISLLPKLSCSDCSKAQGKSCAKHQKAKCRVCDAWISTAHIHLSYVGHAETTDRFLEVDPDWTWEPMAFDDRGLPAFDGVGGLWMRVTIAGVTKPGYGDAQGKTGPNAVKEAIGDGLRNAGMRFGVALNLWAKSDLAALHADKETGDVVDPAPASNGHANSAPVSIKAQIWNSAKAKGWSMEDLSLDYASTHDGELLENATPEQLSEYAEKVAS